MPDVVLLPMAGNVVPPAPLKPPCPGSTLLLSAAAAAVLSALSEAALPAADRDDIREAAKLLALRLLLGARFRDAALLMDAALASPPVTLRPVGLSLPALLVGCRLPAFELLFDGGSCRRLLAATF